MEFELDICPFCGGEADLRLQRGKNGFFTYCQCSTCNAQARTFSIGASCPENWDEETAARRAVKAWNARYAKSK